MKNKETTVFGPSFLKYFNNILLKKNHKESKECDQSNPKQSKTYKTLVKHARETDPPFPVTNVRDLYHNKKIENRRAEKKSEEKKR